MNDPAVTVLLPVFNGGRYLRAAVESILRQRFCDFEVLAIDDGSTDGSPDELASVRDSRVRVLRNERNLGLVATLNRGLAEARGEWIARQDADDLSAPGRLAAQIAVARGNPAVPLIGADAWLVDDAGRYRGRWRTGGHADLVAWDMCFRAPFAHGSALFRRSIVTERFGGYRERPACEDMDLWTRVAAEFPVISLRRPLVKYRLHGASIMAGATADPERTSAVRDVLIRHMERVAPGTGAQECGLIAEVWSGGMPGGWDRYFEALKALELGFLRGRRSPPGFARILGEQHYALYCRVCRTGGGGQFLRALARADAALLPRLPWLRMLAASLRK
ncbi:MAG: glycosyltransferase [Terrimicrobiaceae bacterium]|nr:glycosyltransferase [Terrimicrobiaceae bacterium]